MSGYLRIWVRVPPSFTWTGLYSNSTQYRISVSSVVEEFIVAICRLVMTLKDPADDRIARAEIKQEQEESGQQKHQWTKQRVCSTYEESLESQALGTKARECHIFSTSKKHQQHAQREALWFRLKKGAYRKIKGNQEQTGGVDEVRLTRAGNYLDRTVKEQFRISFLLRSVFDNSYLLQPCKSGNKAKTQPLSCVKRER